MTARPILFSAPMVRALLDGRKTQTRRALKQQPLDILPLQKEKRGREWVSLEQPEPHGRVVRCRFGMPGDVLWVRETWGEYIQDIGDARQDRWYVYRADGKERPSDNGSDVPWTPSIHMPRRVSRITLRISDVRVERLQAISEADAIAEGCPAVSLHDLDCASTPPSKQYRKLWESINGKGSWDANPFVWAISFDVLKQNVDTVMRAAA